MKISPSLGRDYQYLLRNVKELRGKKPVTEREFDVALDTTRILAADALDMIEQGAIIQTQARRLQKQVLSIQKELAADRARRYGG